MKKFEYYSVQDKLTDAQLNLIGEKGWELVTHTALLTHHNGIQYYVFKRRLKSEKKHLRMPKSISH